jgi:hypothetical protein
MSYYTVLSATSALLLNENFTMRRCRRRFNGPHRYVLFDARNTIFHFDENSKNRRMGYTLHELLEWLATNPNAKTADEARGLLHELNTWHQMKTAS